MEYKENITFFGWKCVIAFLWFIVVVACFGFGYYYENYVSIDPQLDDWHVLAYFFGFVFFLYMLLDMTPIRNRKHWADCAVYNRKIDKYNRKVDRHYGEEPQYFDSLPYYPQYRYEPASEVIPR